MIEVEVVYADQIVKLQFEHSLRALSKWESKYKVPFLTERQKSPSEMLDYFQCMLMSPEVDPEVVYTLSPSDTDRLTNYINANLSASSVPKNGIAEINPEITTSELIYFWMVALKINWEAQDWHLSRLLMLINITSYKQQPPKKRSPREILNEMRSENERRKKLLKTSG